MALVSKGFRLSVTMVDNGGDTNVKIFPLTATTFADAVTDSAAILIAYNAVTDCIVRDYSIQNVYANDALVLPAGGVETANTASVVVQIDGEPLKQAVISVPGPVAGMFMGASGDAANTIDTSDGALLTFISLFGPGGVCTLSDGEICENIPLSGKRVHRKTRRG